MLVSHSGLPSKPTRKPEVELVRDREGRDAELNILDRCDIRGLRAGVASAAFGESATRIERSALSSLLLSSSSRAASSEIGIS